MIKQGLLFVLACFLFGCLPKFQTTPERLPQCHYARLSGPVFRFAPLPPSKQYAGYASVYTYTNRGSRSLPYATYLGMRGKLTTDISTRAYAKRVYFGLSGFRCGALNDCEPDHSNRESLYLTRAQREKRDRDAQFVVRKAILENCQVVYIRIDALSKDYLSPQLIIPAGLQLLSTR